MSQSEIADCEKIAKPKLEISASRQLPGWLAEERLSLAFTTYQAGRLFLIGTKGNGRLSIFERRFRRCMGLWAEPETIYMSSLYQLWKFQNALEPGQSYKGFDRLYIPRLGYTTGDLDIHDIAVDVNQRVVFVNTLFSCLATLSNTSSFEPFWCPPFITKLAPEDRCHLNGMAMQDGRPKYVTAVSQSDIAEGWRDRRADRGCVLDVESGEVVASGLSMPHSPRVYQDRLWILDSGRGQLCIIDISTGQCEPVVFCPGYLRGLSFFGNFAVVGLSKARGGTFSGLELDDRLKARDAEPRCGLMIVDLTTGNIVHWFRIEGIIDELYDVCLLPGVIRPMAFGFKTDEIRRIITMGKPA